MVTEWIITEIDGKIASIAADYRHFAEIAAKVAQLPPTSVDVITTQKVSTDELIAMAGTLTWEDFRLFGTKFQLGVWKTLFELEPRLYSYSEFAALCGNPQGVRSVAHAVAINPITYIFPCHLIIPKESMDKAREIRAGAESTLFKGSDLYLLDSIDVGEYAYGTETKRDRNQAGAHQTPSEKVTGWPSWKFAAAIRKVSMPPCSEERGASIFAPTSRPTGLRLLQPGSGTPKPATLP